MVSAALAKRLAASSRWVRVGGEFAEWFAVGGVPDGHAVPFTDENPLAVVKTASRGKLLKPLIACFCLPFWSQILTCRSRPAVARSPLWLDAP